MKIYRSFDQNSAEWFSARMGIPTASVFHKIITPTTLKLSSQHAKLACQLIAERLLNQPTETVKGQEWMDRGRELEPYAVDQFQVVHEVELEKVAFVTTNDGTIGCSPDRLEFTASGRKLLAGPALDFTASGSDINLSAEIKCPALATHVYYLLLSQAHSFSPEVKKDQDIYKCQVQGQMLVCENEKRVLYSYFPRGPAVEIRSDRDEKFIAALEVALRQFNDKLHEWHEIAKRFGTWQAFERVLTPTEIEEASNLRDAPSDEDVQMAIDADYDWGAN